MHNSLSAPSSVFSAPLQALVIDCERFIAMLRSALAELHERRLQTPHLTGESDIGRTIRYWDSVLGWTKDQHASELVLISRSETPTTSRIAEPTEPPSYGLG